MVVRRWKTTGYVTMAAIGVGLAVFAATEGTTKGHTDDAFVNKVRGLGIGFTSADSVIATANNVCHSLHNGETAVAVKRDLVHHSHLNGDKAGQFMAVAVHTYCPQYTDKVESGQVPGHSQTA